MSIWYHLHGALTHFPIALAITSFALDFAGAAFRKSSLRAAGLWTLLLAALAVVPTVATGFFTANDYATAKSLIVHRNIAIGAGVLLLGLALWRGLRRDDMTRRGFIAYLVGVLLAAGAVGLTGWLGSQVVNYS